MDLNIYFQNNQRINNKISNLKSQIYNTMYDILLTYTETWLKNHRYICNP